jgi:hypothetical protein
MSIDPFFSLTPLSFDAINPVVESSIVAEGFTSVKDTTNESLEKLVASKQAKEKTAGEKQELKTPVKASTFSLREATYSYNEYEKHSEQFRKDLLSELLESTFNDFEKLKENVNSPERIVYIGSIDNKFDKSWEIITQNDRSIALTISTLQETLKDDAWSVLKKNQVETIKDIITKIVDQEEINYYEYALSELSQSGINILPTKRKSDE